MPARTVALLAFANAQSVESDIVRWCVSFKSALVSLLPEADRVSLDVNRGAMLDPAEGAHSEIATTQYACDDEGRLRAQNVTSGTRRDQDFFVSNFRRSGFPVDDYALPHVENYSTQSGEHLSSIILWQRRDSRGSLEQAVARLRSLAPFISMLFTSAIGRYHRAHADYAAAVLHTRRITQVTRMSPREKEVFLCRFLGKNIQETASNLGVSEATVRRHLRSINERISRLGENSTQRIGLPLIRRQSTP